MAKTKSIFYCMECGSETGRWMGQCSVCGAWNTMVEKIITSHKTGRSKQVINDTIPIQISKIEDKKTDRIYIKNDEWNRTLGGGLVKGSLVLLGGDPGVGKSTLVLQVAAEIAKQGKVLYASGEESAAQIRLRANRLNIHEDNCFIYAATDLTQVLEHAKEMIPELLIIDSIQTMYVDTVQGAPGSIAQVKESTAHLLRFAKESDIPIIIVGHVTKDGNIAGPRMLEHMVDTVLYLEGDPGYPLRVLRAVKNRFGNTAESGVFIMESTGLCEVTDLSKLLLSERSRDQVGTIVFAGMEGIRPLLVEVQALTNRTYYGTARRTAIGYDYNRLSIVLAVLEKKAGIQVAEDDVYINVAGGIKVNDTAIDLPVALSVVSVLKEIPIPTRTAAIGEIGLTGDIRRVNQVESRIRELEKMGFSRVLLPTSNYDKNKYEKSNLEIIPVSHVRDAITLLTNSL